MWCGGNPEDRFCMAVKKLKKPLGNRKQAAMCSDCVVESYTTIKRLTEDLQASREGPLH